MVSLLVLAGPLSARDREEMIILFDTSVSVTPIYSDLAALVVRGIEENQIQRGDGLHLLSFAEEPVYELSQDVRTSEDIGEVKSYLELLKPMGLHTDLLMALNYLYSFTKDLSINSRKTILILTDGIHDPPPGSPSYGRGDDYIQRALREITEKINRQGWNVRILQLDPAYAGGDPWSEESPPAGRDSSPTTDGGAASPAVGTSEDSGVLGSGGISGSESDVTSPGASADAKTTDPISGGESAPPDRDDNDNYIDLMSEELKAPVTPFQQDQDELASRMMGVAHLSFSEELGEVRRQFTLPLEITNYGKLPVAVSLQEILSGGSNILKEKINREIDSNKSRTLKSQIELPPHIEPGDHSLEVEFIFADGAKVSPSQGILHFTLVASRGGGIDKTALFAAAALILLAAIITLAVFIRRRLERNADEDTYRHKAAVRAGQEEGPARVDTVAPGPEKIGRTKAAKAPSASAGSDAPVAAAPSGTSQPPASGGPKTSDGTEKSAKAASPRDSKVPLLSVNENHVLVKQHKEEIKAKGIPAIHPQDYPYVIEMKVEGQNPFLGQRNLRVVKEDAPKLVGGRGMPYHIFLHPVPAGAAELSFDGKKYIFTPLKSEVFPGMESPLADCLNLWIPLKAANGRTVRIRFTRWVSPLERLNKLMHCIDKAGVPSDYF